MEISLLAVGLAGLAAFIIGFVWYLPAVFGTKWMAYTGTPDEMAPNMVVRMVLALIAQLLSAYVLAHIMLMFLKATGKDAFTFWEAAQFGFWPWLGFAVPPILSAVLWERKDWRLFVLNGGYWLVAAIAMTLIIAFL